MSVERWVSTGLNLAIAAWLWWLMGRLEARGRPRVVWAACPSYVALVHLLVLALLGSGGGEGEEQP